MRTAPRYFFDKHHYMRLPDTDTHVLGSYMRRRTWIDTEDNRVYGEPGPCLYTKSESGSQWPDHSQKE